MIFNLVGGGSSGSAGASLNFSVDTYLTDEALPTSAEENAIAVVTGTQMTSWIFSPVEPTNPENGVVWFGSKNASDYNFNALNENSIVICLDVAKQYIDGTWVQQTAYIYQNGAWNKFSVFVTMTQYDLFNGQDNTEVTGGWTYHKWVYGEAKYPLQMKMTDDAMVLYQTCTQDTDINGAYATTNQIDMTGISKLVVTFDAYISNGAQYYPVFYMDCTTTPQEASGSGVKSEILIQGSSSVGKTASLTDAEVTMDVSNINELRHVSFRANCGTAYTGGVEMTLTVKKLTMIPA